MEVIKYEKAERGKNSEVCSTLEYSFKDSDIDVGVAVITGRFPGAGYCMNLVSKELIYVLEGSGKIVFEDKEVEFSKNDAILIDKEEKYYWDTEYAKVTMTCTPAWSSKQHILLP